MCAAWWIPQATTALSPVRRLSHREHQLVNLLQAVHALLLSVLLDSRLTHHRQDTVAEMAKDIKAKRTGDTSANAAELYAFVNRVRHLDTFTPNNPEP